MIAPFDIFQTAGDGTVLWKGSETSLEAAKERVKELAATQPGEYVIQSLQTGHKTVIMPNGSEVSQNRTAGD